MGARENEERHERSSIWRKSERASEQERSGTENGEGKGKGDLGRVGSFGERVEERRKKIEKGGRTQTRRGRGGQSEWWRGGGGGEVTKRPGRRRNTRGVHLLVDDWQCQRHTYSRGQTQTDRQSDRQAGRRTPTRSHTHAHTGGCLSARRAGLRTRGERLRLLSYFFFGRGRRFALGFTVKLVYGKRKE